MLLGLQWDPKGRAGGIFVGGVRVGDPAGLV